MIYLKRPEHHINVTALHKHCVVTNINVSFSVSDHFATGLKRSLYNQPPHPLPPPPHLKIFTSWSNTESVIELNLCYSRYNKKSLSTLLKPPAWETKWRSSPPSKHVYHEVTECKQKKCHTTSSKDERYRPKTNKEKKLTWRVNVLVNENEACMQHFNILPPNWNLEKIAKYHFTGYTGFYNTKGVANYRACTLNDTQNAGIYPDYKT